jgi:ABC-type phosphate transport system substrate-binding protein
MSTSMEGPMKALRVACVVIALSSTAHGAILLDGSGSTFAFPLYSKWIAAFQQREPDITLTSASVGSGAGIADISAGRTDEVPSAAACAHRARGSRAERWAPPPNTELALSRA